MAVLNEITYKYYGENAEKKKKIMGKL
jgi:hypothetical protein